MLLRLLLWFIEHFYAKSFIPRHKHEKYIQNEAKTAEIARNGGRYEPYKITKNLIFISAGKWG